MQRKTEEITSTSASSSTSTSTSVVPLSFRQFVDTCKSPATRQTYVKALHYFIKYLGLSAKDYDYDKLLDKDAKSIQMDICDFITHLKVNHSAAAVSTYVAAINKFYSMNDVTTLNWKKIKSFMGEHEKVAEDRPYTHSEIQTLIEHTTLRNRAIILLMSSAGLRLGAIPLLRIRDIIPIDNYQIYKINVYAKSKRSSYFSYCSVECRREIDSYLDYRRRWAERLTDESPLFRSDFNIQKVTQARPITTHGIRDFMNDLLIRTGLRKLRTEGKVRRSHIMANHGCRKFFETNAFKAGMDLMYIRRLMGQKSGELEEAYLQISEQELLEGDSKHVGYIGIIDQLTIDDSNKLRREIQTLRVEKSHWEALRSELDELKEMMFNPKSK